MTHDERVHIVNDLYWIASDIEDHRTHRLFISRKSRKFMKDVEARLNVLIEKIDPTGDLAFEEYHDEQSRHSK